MLFHFYKNTQINSSTLYNKTVFYVSSSDVYSFVSSLPMFAVEEGFGGTMSLHHFSRVGRETNIVISCDDKRAAGRGSGRDLSYYRSGPGPGPVPLGAWRPQYV